MLVLTRKTSEQIQIGDRVVITILRVKGQSVRIGIDAPRDVLVLRTELPKYNSSSEEADHNSPQANEPETKARRNSPLGGRLASRRADRRFEMESRDTTQFLNAVRCAASC